MRFVILWLMLLGFGSAKRLISIEETEVLFKKFMFNELTTNERETLQDVLDLFRIDDDLSSVIENSSGTRSTLNCLLCRNIFNTLFEGVQQGQTDEQVINTITVLCYSLGIESQKICSGAIALNLPIFTYIIRTTPEATPRAFCSFVLQTATDPNVCSHNDPRFEWQVDLPQPSTVVQTPSTDTRPLKIAVLTDAHIDPLYEAYGVANCDEPVCCRKGQSPAQSSLQRSVVDQSAIQESLVNISGKLMLDLDVANQLREIRQVSIRTARNDEPAGYWGDYRNCDSPIWAYDDVVETIAENHPDVDVVYYVGDSIDHGVWETSYDLINDMNLYIIEKLRSTFGDDVPVIPVIGNHESQPTNQFAPSRVSGEGLNTTWLYETLANKWDYYLTEEAKTSLRERGDFSLLIRPGLRVISLNNNVAYRYNWWLVFDPTDSENHLDWLIQELYRAELAGEKVHLLTHIPPGVNDLVETWTREYNRIINRFSATIAAEFNGHVHSDEFKIYYSSTTGGSPVAVAWGAGSATAYTNYNLNYKIATFDPATLGPIDIVTYVYNLTEANLTPNRRPHWFELYDIRHRFGVTDLSPTSMDSLVNRMVTNSQFLDLYAAFFSKLSDTRWPYCNDDCKIDYLCRTVVTVLYERQRCDELRNLFYSRK